MLRGSRSLPRLRRPALPLPARLQLSSRNTEQTTTNLGQWRYVGVDALRSGQNVSLRDLLAYWASQYHAGRNNKNLCRKADSHLWKVCFVLAFVALVPAMTLRTWTPSPTSASARPLRIRRTSPSCALSKTARVMTRSTFYLRRLQV